MLYLVKSSIPVLTTNHNIYWRLIVFFVEFCGVVGGHAGDEFAFVDRIHNIRFAIVRVNLHPLTHVQEIQILGRDVFVRRRYLRLGLHMSFHIALYFLDWELIGFIRKIKAKVRIDKMIWYFEVAAEAFVGGVLLRQIPYPAGRHLPHVELILPFNRRRASNFRAVWATLTSSTDPWALFSCRWLERAALGLVEEATHLSFI